MGGAVIQWLRDELQLLSHASDSEKMACTVKDTNGVIIVPAFTGLGAPYWDMDARGIITGLTRGTNRNHIVRAALESIAFQKRRWTQQDGEPGIPWMIPTWTSLGKRCQIHKENDGV